jgi:hypothetical protein
MERSLIYKSAIHWMAAVLLPSTHAQFTSSAAVFSYEWAYKSKVSDTKWLLHRASHEMATAWSREYPTFIL